MKPLRIVLLAAVMLITLSACETIKGLGRDITNAGEALEEAVN